MRIYEWATRRDSTEQQNLFVDSRLIRGFASDINSDRSGQSVLEILIALALLVISVTAVIVISLGSQSVSVSSVNTNDALYIASENLETIRAQARNNFNSIEPSTATNGIYTEDILVENIDSFTKRITSRVSWITDPLRPQKVELVSLITDPLNLFNLGGDAGCSGGLSGAWTNPVAVGSIDLDPAVVGSSLDIVNGVLYISGTSSSTAKSDFFIINISNPNAPTIISDLEVGSKGINTLDVSLNYAYGANNSISGQLLTIDVTDSDDPVLINSFTLPGVLGSGAIGNAIFYYGGKIYIGTKKATGPELHVIDVSIPLAPVALGSYEINSDVNMIKVSGDYAYLATSADNSEIKVLNISDPGNITSVNYDMSGTSDALSLFVFQNKLFVGRSGGNELAMLDITTPNAPAQLGSTTIGAPVNSIAGGTSLALIGTSDSNTEFQVWNIANPTNMSLVSSLNLPNIANGGIDCDSNSLYLGLRSNDSLRTITSQ